VSSAGYLTQILEDDAHEDAVVRLDLAVSVVGALGYGLDEEALVLVAEADLRAQGAFILQVAPVSEADAPVLVEARRDAEGDLLAIAELVGGVGAPDEEIGEGQVERRRADVEQYLVAPGGEVVLVEAEAIQ